MEHINFPSIEKFATVKKEINYRLRQVQSTGVLTFFGTEKLHGACCSIQTDSESNVTFQSRNRIITPEDDVYGFATYMSALLKDVVLPPNIIIDGEWAGKGIQNKVAICQLEKFWAIFCIRSKVEADKYLDITSVTLPFPLDSRIYLLESHKRFMLQIDFNDLVQIQRSCDIMNYLTDEVERESPFALDHGISGIGEGIVWKCVTPGWTSSRFWFKTKGKKHVGKTPKVRAAPDFDKLKSLQDFKERFLHEERLKQAFDFLKEMDLAISIKSLGSFLKWLHDDIIKEESDVLEISGLERKEIGKVISDAGKKWFFNKLEIIE